MPSSDVVIDYLYLHYAVLLIFICTNVYAQYNLETENEKRGKGNEKQTETERQKQTEMDNTRRQQINRPAD